MITPLQLSALRRIAAGKSAFGTFAPARGHPAVIVANARQAALGELRRLRLTRAGKNGPAVTDTGRRALAAAERLASGEAVSAVTGAESGAALAERLGISAGAMRNRLYRARAARAVS